MKKSPLRKSIEEIIESEEEKRYLEIKEKISNIIKAQKEISDEITELKKAAERIERIENDFLREREKIKEEIRKDILAHKEAVAKTALEISELKDEVAELKSAREELKKMKAKEIFAGLASLEQKTKWVEAQIEQANIPELKSKIDTLSLELEKLKASASLVIE